MTTIERTYNECHEQIYRHALKVVKNIHDAEDIRGNVYKKITELKSCVYDEHNEKQAQFSSWISTITNSVILDFFKANNKQRYFTAVSDFADTDEGEKSFFSFVAPERSNADSLALNNELQERIDKAFDELKPKYRRVATLFFIRGYGYTEISEMLNVPMGTVKGMLSRAREVLQTELQGMLNLKTVTAEA